MGYGSQELDSLVGLDPQLLDIRDERYFGLKRKYLRICIDGL